MPFYGFNREGAKVSEGVRDSFWLQGMMAGHKNALDCIKAFSETDFTKDLERIDVPTLIMHGARDSIVPAANSRRAVAALQAVGAPHLYLEFPDKDHEFWIRRGAAQMEKVFLFFSLVSKRTSPGITPH